MTKPTEPMKPVDWLPAAAVVRLFTPEECGELLEKVEQSDIFYEAERLADDGTTYVDDSYRVCQTGHLYPGDELYDLIAKRIQERIAFVNAKFEFDLYPELERLLPVININRYPGDHERAGRIAMHQDVGPFEGVDDRKLSLSILLNDPKEYEGGRFRIFNGGHVWPLNGQNPTAGTTIVFPSFAVHGVEPVVAGVRYSVVIWLRGPRFR